LPSPDATSYARAVARLERTMSKTTFALVLLALVAACAADTGDGIIAAAAAPEIGKADGSDFADRACGIVLRDAGRAPAETGYETDCSTGRCWFVIPGHVDVRESYVSGGASVGVLFSSTWQPGWFEARATRVTDAASAPGFVRYAFRIAENTMESGASATALERTRISLLPFVRTEYGARYFDHNRRPADFDVYELDRSNDFAVADDSAVCRAEPASRSTLEFTPSWDELQHGAITPGGELTILYDLARLPECRNTHNGHPAWDTLAHVRFQPSGAMVEGSVREFESVHGTPTTTAFTRPFTVRVPEGTSRVEVWFENYSGAGSTCRKWDSEFGTNYAFEAVSTLPAEVGWAGVSGGSWSRECAHRDDGVADPARVDGYTMERACTFVDADVWVPGLTDAGGDHPERIVAEVEWRVDDGDLRRDFLGFEGKVGNDYRFRWELPRSEMTYSPWNTIEYAMRFSTDGITFHRVGREDGPEGGDARLVERDPSWCPSAWPAGSCTP
jgi:hypothetical protein